MRGREAIGRGGTRQERRKRVATGPGEQKGVSWWRGRDDEKEVTWIDTSEEGNA